MMDQISWIAVFPEAFLLVMACVIALADLRPQSLMRGLTFTLTMVTLGLVASLEAFYATTGLTLYGFGNMVVADTMASLKESELARAQAIWLKKFGQLAKDAANRNRQARFLATRGFSGDVVRQVVSGSGLGEEET
jgi:hypothetical protein